VTHAPRDDLDRTTTVLRRWAHALLLLGVLGLSACATVPANAPSPAAPAATAAPQAPTMPPPAVPAVPATGAAPSMPSPALPPPPSVPPPPPDVAPAPATIVLLLPSQSTPFARAAEVVRQGFFAARAVAGPSSTVRVIEIDEDPGQLMRALAAARQQGADVIAGPLTRTQVNTTMKANLSVPTVTLSLPESDALAPPALLAFGLSIEQEARAMVQAAVRSLAPPMPGMPTRLTPRFVLLVGEGALSRRAGAAFRDALREAGERVTVFKVDLKYDALQAIGDRVFREGPEGVFLALDAREAAIVRPRLPHDLLLFSTSQVHLGGGESALLANDLEGIHFVDAPWLLEPDHPAVMVYARPEQAMSAELNRLYALGIDAYRLATEWAAGRKRFELDGVTGALQVDRTLSARVERWPSFAVFRKGRVERVSVPRPGPPL
jgi:outer membrane PBP1 activator LpoA protein